MLGPLGGRPDRRPQNIEFAEEVKVTGVCVCSRPMQALSCSLSPQLLGHLCFTWGPPTLPHVLVAQILISQAQSWLGWLRVPPFSKGKSLGIQDWSANCTTPAPSALASSKPTLAGGLKCVYFLDLFFNKKEKEQKVLLWMFFRNRGLVPFRSPRARFFKGPSKSL